MQSFTKAAKCAEDGTMGRWILLSTDLYGFSFKGDLLGTSIVKGVTYTANAVLSLGASTQWSLPRILRRSTRSVRSRMEGYSPPVGKTQAESLAEQTFFR